ncbi:ATP-binding cassette domain-containing protein [Sinirhodobacter populi]|uniref:ATP-binding cassette domain-containing protein n=1 Tax=Paenirhodobacter populi TaxID=2306993 RepID=A0A443K113_9RHOB|nr:ATP-binding cassette domain-containing protein [Sinirhodobacter populi]
MPRGNPHPGCRNRHPGRQRGRGPETTGTTGRTHRLTVEKIYKIFGHAPQQALARLREGGSKQSVLAASGHVVGLNDVSLSIPAGSIYMVTGLSGSGQSTLARGLNRLIEPDAGRILLDGEDILQAGADRLREIRRARIAMMFQHFALLPNKSVVENVEFGLKLRGVPRAERRAKAREMLDIVCLAEWSDRPTAALSGGMRQRVGLARAHATDADLLIMDEAFSALDPLIRTEMQDELLRLQKMLKKTIVFITHDFQEAVRIGTRIAIMAEGQMMRDGTPQDIVEAPGSDYVAAFTRGADRSRLFDARTVMAPPGTPSRFALDAAGRLLGAADGGQPLTVAPGANLAEVAAACLATDLSPS